ncbi:aldo/keto reductase [Puniceicoccaceae bacterium K14]|nr:aldo/keto reductase [Puniceicoccaceae bacterium K14]
MELRTLGNSGLKVPVLCLGTATFGGEGPLFSNWGTTDAAEATRMIDVCLDAGANFFDTADVYSDGASETLLGIALKGKRNRALISSKLTLQFGQDERCSGSSRSWLIEGLDASLKRLGTDYLDILQLHAFDARTPIEETLSTLEQFIQSGKVRYIGVSNFSGWQLMKSLAVSEQCGFSRYVAHQVYYSLLGRDYEHDLMPLGQDQGVGAIVWSPLGWGRLTGKIRRGEPWPRGSRLHETANFGPDVEDEAVYKVVDIIDEIAEETGKSVPQIAINWLIGRPTVSSVIMGARNESQLLDNLGSSSFSLSNEQIERLDRASATSIPYPHYPYHKLDGFKNLNPPLIHMQQS